MSSYISRIKPNGAEGTEYKLKDEEARSAIQNTNNNVRGSQTTSGNPITITDAAPIKAEQLVFEIEPIQAGSGTPSPSNIRAITGLSEVSGGTCGKNLFTTESATENYYLNESGSAVSNSNWNISDYIKLYSDHITLSVNSQMLGNSPSLCFYDANKNYISGIKYADRTSITFEIPQNAIYFRASYEDSWISSLQIEDGQTPTTYEPYNGSNVTVQFNQTVYGGTLTLNADGSAEVLVHTGYDIYDGSNDETWTRVQQTSASAFLIAGYASRAIYYTDKALIPEITSNYLKPISENAAWGSNNGFITTNINLTDGLFYIGIQSITTVEAWRTFLASNNLQVCYKLATPFTIHLTAEQLQLLENLNNISTNAKTLTVKYQPNNAIGEAKIYANETAEIVAKEYTTESDTVDTDIYLYRASKNSGDRCYLRQLVGASFGVNQLVQNGNFASSSGWTTNGATGTYSNNSYVLNQSAAGNFFYVGRGNTTDLIAGHKYLASIDLDVTTAVEGQVHFGFGTETISTELAVVKDILSGRKVYSGIITVNSNASKYASFRFVCNGATTTLSVTVRNFMVIDLTQWFNSQIADYATTAGIAWLKSYGFFTESYYPYSTGSLQSVNTSGKVNTEKNLFDAQQTRGGTVTDGQIVIDDRVDGWISTSDTVIPQNTTTLYVSIKDKGTYSGSFYPELFDENHVWIDNDLIPSINFSSITVPYNTTVTLPSNVKYIRLRGWNSNGGTAKIKTVEVCVSIINTEYEPYTTHTTPISSIDLRGVPKLVDNNIVYDGDVRDESGTVTRKYGIIDLGTQNFATAGATSVFSLALYGRKSGSCKMKISNSYSYANPYISGNDKCYIENSDSGNIQLYFKDSSYTDTTAFKTAMSGVYLVYELATPTTEQTTPIQNPEIYSQFGWEQFIDNRDYPIPVGHNSEYVNLPDWMETGYVGDLRDRVDYDIPKAIERLSEGNYSRNTLPLSVEHIKAKNAGTWSGNSIAINNVTFTIVTNDDGDVIGINRDGTSNASTLFTIFRGKYPSKGKFLSSGMKDGQVFLGHNDTFDTSINYSNTNFSITSENDELLVRIGFASGQTFNNDLIQPMVTDSNVEDISFQEYIPTNKELWEMIKALQQNS